MGTVLVGYCLGCEGGVVQGVRLNGTSFSLHRCGCGGGGGGNG